MKDATTAQTPGKGSVWRPLSQRESLPDLHSGPGPLTTDDAEYGIVMGGGKVHGANRCSAIGLRAGDCTMQRVLDSRYCYYHEKQANGDIGFCMEARALVVHSDAGTEQRTTWQEVSPKALYPVWTLPSSGYAFLDREEVAA